jgi:ferric-dicitrate binding protein FerR (iron transport regulator)
VTVGGGADWGGSRDAGWPCVASVADDRLRVKVLGTEFNLQAFSDDANITVTLVSGKVDVEAKGSGNKIYAGTLLPSEKAIYDTHSGTISIEKANIASETGWIEGKLIFRNSLMSDVLKKLSYFYNVRFDVKREAINQYHFTGTFDNKQLFQVLEILNITSDIRLQIKQVTEDDKQTVVIIQ